MCQVLRLMEKISWVYSLLLTWFRVKVNLNFSMPSPFPYSLLYPVTHLLLFWSFLARTVWIVLESGNLRLKGQDFPQRCEISGNRITVGLGAESRLVEWPLSASSAEKMSYRSFNPKRIKSLEYSTVWGRWLWLWLNEWMNEWGPTVNKNDTWIEISG